MQILFLSWVVFTFVVYRVAISSVLYYDSEALSIVCRYSSSPDKSESANSCLLAQLPVEAFAGVAMDTVSGGSLTAEMLKRWAPANPTHTKSMGRACFLSLQAPRD